MPVQGRGDPDPVRGRPAVQVVLRDVTEEQRAGEELRQSREWFRVMGEALPYGVWRCNARGGAEYVSQSFLDLLEMTEEEMREFGWTHRLPPDEVAPMLERWMRCIETGEDWDDEHHVLGPDGVYHTVLTRGRPVRDSDGAIVAWVGINLDIDERKRTEEAIAADLEALTRMHALSCRLVEREGLEPLLQEIMETAVAIMGAEKGTLQLADGGSLRIAASHGHDEPFLTFFAAAEARASACGLAMAERDRVVVPDVEASSVFAGTPSLDALRAAGVRAVQSTPLLSRAGELVGVLTTHWSVPHTPDEHDLWRLDLLARQAADLIEHAWAVEALREYAEDLKRSNEDLERYAYVSSHDLQEPLRSIVSFSQLLERRYKGQLGEDADEYINFIVDGGNRMQSLIQDLLAYSRVNTTRQALRPTETEDVLAAVERHLDLQLREVGAVITHDPVPTVLADPLQLEQVFVNLVSQRDQVPA